METTVKMTRKNAQFKFIFNGEYKVSSLYNTRFDNACNLNNVLYYSKEGIALAQNSRREEPIKPTLKLTNVSTFESLDSLEDSFHQDF